MQGALVPCPLSHIPCDLAGCRCHFVPVRHSGCRLLSQAIFCALGTVPNQPEEGQDGFYLRLHLQLSLIRAEENAVRAFHSWDLLWPEANPASSTGRGDLPHQPAASSRYMAINTPQRSVGAASGVLPGLGLSRYSGHAAHGGFAAWDALKSCGLGLNSALLKNGHFSFGASGLCPSVHL